MKSKASHQHSTNIQIECLGKSTSINAHDAKAALACQDEVHELRETAVSALLRSALKNKEISFTDGPEVMNQAYGAAE